MAPTNTLKAPHVRIGIRMVPRKRACLMGQCIRMISLCPISFFCYLSSSRIYHLPSTSWPTATAALLAPPDRTLTCLHLQRLLTRQWTCSWQLTPLRSGTQLLGSSSRSLSNSSLHSNKMGRPWSSLLGTSATLPNNQRRQCLLVPTPRDTLQPNPLCLGLAPQRVCPPLMSLATWTPLGTLRVSQKGG